jgi:hypothetical protein
MTSVRIKNNTVASAFNKPMYSMRGSCAYKVRYIIIERRANNLRIAVFYLLF